MTILRTRWAAIGAAVAVSLGAGGLGLAQAAIGSGDKPVTVTIEPERILDTRDDLGLAGRFQSGVPRDLQVTGNVPVASGGSSTVVPSDAVAVLVNVTIVTPDSFGFLSLRPAGAVGEPTTSTVNFVAGDVVPNSATVDLGPGGKVQVWLRTADPVGSADVLVDVVGYTVDHTHNDLYYTESEVDALIGGPPPSADYENLIVVAKSGGDFTSVGAAVDAIGVDPAYPAATSSNRYLVWVAPGVYENEDVDMQPYVDIEGSGQGVTVLHSVGGAGGISPDAATLVGADNAELRHVTVEIEAAAPGNWTHAIYTAGKTTFRNVTAVSSGGSRARGMMVQNGTALMIDVVLLARDASSSNLALDVWGGLALADGLFAEASGGDVAQAIFVNQAPSEVRLENVTTRAFNGSFETVGVRTNESSVTLEGLRATAVGPSTSSVMGVRCDDEGYTVQVLDATIYAENEAADVAYGVYGLDCDLELRNAVVDAVSASGSATGAAHFQGDGAQPADVTIADVELRAVSTEWAAYGLRIASTGVGPPIGTYGRVTDVNARATGGSGSTNSYAVRHSAVGEVQYRGLSLIANGSANFMYGIRADDGAPRFDDVVIDAVGTAESTVFGVEFTTGSSTLTNARVKAVNVDTGDLHDAVGIKANAAAGVEFTDVTVYAEAETNVWGADLVGSDTRLARVDARAVSTSVLGESTGAAHGVRCWGVSTELHDSLFRGASADATSYGLLSSDCDGTVTGSELVADGSAQNYGMYAESTSGIRSTTVRESYLAGSDATIWSSGAATVNVQIVLSQLDGGTGFSNSVGGVQECTAVTYNSGGPETFQAGTSDPCP